MTKALKIAGDVSNKIHAIFISVDPERDTPEVLKQYLPNFSDKFIGLTGTEDQVDKAMDSFKVYAAKTDDPEYADYMMSHSSYIYFLDDKGNLKGIYKKEDTAEKIAKDLLDTLR
jgi:protein SCO1/2